jgi:hypothetical protein
MLNLDGFVVDLTTEEMVDESLKFACEDEFYQHISDNLEEKRYFIMQYYVNNYAFVFMKAPYVLQIVEEELYV